MANIAIIPARGGSTRVPRKNIRMFCGKPVIEYSIEAALKSGIFVFRGKKAPSPRELSARRAD